MMLMLLGGVLLWLAMGVLGAIYLRRKNSWALMLGGTVLALYGAIPGIGLSMDGRQLNNWPMELSGQLLLLFFSVLGGALVSSAWTELRASALIANSGKG